MKRKRRKKRIPRQANMKRRRRRFTKNGRGVLTKKQITNGKECCYAEKLQGRRLKKSC
jgi:hypothetical protein